MGLNPTILQHSDDNETTLLRLFRQGEYTSGVVESPEVIFQTSPKWFQFVIVQHGTENEVVNESFYTILGDVTTIKFSGGSFSGLESNPYSNLVFVGAAIIGVGLGIFANFLALPILALLVGEQNALAHQLSKYGTVVFFSIFFSASIKMIFDFVNHLKFSVGQSNSN